MKVLHFCVILLLIVGGLNWFLIGVFDINLVSNFFGEMSFTSRIIYILVGLSALYAVLNFKKYL
jgi:uncharacterized membrane protein YuzA (DUF378 family)